MIFIYLNSYHILKKSQTSKKNRIHLNAAYRFLRARFLVLYPSWMRWVEGGKLFSPSQENATLFVRSFSIMVQYHHQMSPWKHLNFEFPAKKIQKFVMWKFIFFSVFISKFGGSHLFYPNSEPRRVQNGKLWPTALSHRCQDQYLLEGLCM